MILVDAEKISYSIEIIDLVKVFFPNEQVININWNRELPDKYLTLTCGYNEDKTDENSYIFYANIKSSCDSNKDLYHEIIANISDEAKDKYRLVKNYLKSCVYDLLSKYTGEKPKWGILTGIRPLKIIHELMDDGVPLDKIREKLKQDYRVDKEKIELMLDTATVQRPFLANIDHKRVSIYINIPICASKCLYCSFPSDLIERVSGLIKPYLQSLELEIKKTMDIFDKRGIKVDTVYIGGGTPTVLDYEDLKFLLDIIDNHISSKHSIIEYTVEAGRPDSLDLDKLFLLKEYGVNRLSINPQTMNQKTLDLIGRNHTVEDIINIFNSARKVGFDNINMDVIIGLPGETASDVDHTMEEISKLKPENITMHTLYIKRASALRDTFKQYDETRKGLAEEMASICKKWVSKQGMKPYYLYRQKYMLDHLENIGYSIYGKECLYNIYIMSEKRSIWAFGAGSSTKVYYPLEDRLERIANVKNLEIYINKIDEIIGRKESILRVS